MVYKLVTVDDVVNVPAGDVNVYDVAHQMKMVRVFNDWLLNAWRVFGEQVDYSSYSLAFRTVFVFPNGYIFTLPNDASAVLSHLSEELSENHEIFDSFTGDVLDKEQWKFEPAVNGWQRQNFVAFEELDSDMFTIISRFTSLWGAPKLVLPWQDIMDNVCDDKEYYLEQAEDKDTEGATEDAEAFRTVVSLMESVKDGVLQKYSPWTVEIVWGTDYVSNYSGVGRVFRLANELEDNGWFVSLDEHCGSCLSGTRKSFNESEPEKINAPEFITWGQSSSYEFFPDGSSEVHVYTYVEEEAEKLFPYLVKYGFYDEGAWNTMDTEGEIDFLLKIGNYSAL